MTKPYSDMAFFASFDSGVGGGGGLRGHPLELQSTTHPMANKITHNNVLIISNYWANLIDIMT